MPEEDTSTGLLDDKTEEMNVDLTGNDDEPKPHWSGEYEGLSDDTKTLLTKYETREAAFEAHTSLDKLRGNSISLPKDDATDEEKAEQMGKVFNKLGRPETAEGYDLKIPTDLPDQLKPSDEATSEYLAWAHAQGLNQAQMQAIADLQVKKLVSGLEGAQQAQDEATANAKAEKAAKREKDVAELKVEWGEEFDKKMDLAEKAYDIYGRNPVERARLFYQVYLNRLAEDMLVAGRGAVKEGGKFFDYDTEG